MPKQRGPLGRFINRLKWTAWRLLRRIGDRVGFDVVWRDYYSSIPNPTLLPERVWSEPAPMRGIDFDLERGFEFFESELARFVPEFDPPRSEPGPDGYFLDNIAFGSVDAETLYAMVRKYRPERIIELGSGSSSLVIEAALRSNAADGGSTAYEVFDPFPWIESPRPDGREVSRISAADVPLETFASLGRDDILFVDTTHTVKPGGEVNYIVLEVLPALRPGVLVHVHDIFLPWEYPREWITEQQWYWAEQYLLQAFLISNDDYEILFAASASAKADPDRLARLIPSFSPGRAPASFWLRRRS